MATATAGGLFTFTVLFFLALVAVYVFWQRRKNLAKQTPEEGPEVHTPITPRFEVDNPAAYEYLKEEGYVVIKNVATSDEVENARKLMFDFLEGTRLSFKKNDISTWDNWPGFAGVGIISGHGIGQSKFLWFLRSLPKVKEAFSRVWNDQNLLTSFDGCGIFRPWFYRDYWKTKGQWYHVDQSPITRPDRCCVQGMVSLYDQDKTTGGLVVVPGSNKRFLELKTIPHTRDFVPVPETHSILDSKIKSEFKYRPPQLVSCAAGDLILWDSRTVHCSTPCLTRTHRPCEIPEQEQAAKGRKFEMLRAVAYICMTPLKFAKNQDQIVKQRIACFRGRQTTTHWPHELYPVEEKSPVPNDMPLTAHQIDLLTGGMPVSPKEIYSAPAGVAPADGRY